MARGALIGPRGKEDARKLTAARDIAGDHHVPAFVVQRRIEKLCSALEQLERELPAALDQTEDAQPQTVPVPPTG